MPKVYMIVAAIVLATVGVAAILAVLLHPEQMKDVVVIDGGIYPTSQPK